MPGLNSISAGVVLLVFYLVVLVKPGCIKRGPFFLIGIAGLLLVLLTGFFLPWAGKSWANVLIGLFSTIGAIVAFASAVLACYGGKLPVAIPGEQSQQSEPSPPAQQ